MWADRLRDEPRYREALEELWPHAVSTLEPDLRPDLAARIGLDLPSNKLLRGLERGSHVDEWPALWEEMTMVRRSVVGATW
jgi:1,2-phenylacetyl-CoA epoxidase catalytic subunit